MNFSPRSALAIAAFCSWIGMVACGDGSDSNASTDTPPPGGIHERFLSENSTATLDLTHTVLVVLEAAGGHPGDTGSEHGVDEIPYFFPPGTELTLAVAEELAEAPTLQLMDHLGTEVAQAGPGQPGRTITVSGSHKLVLRHPQAGIENVDPLIIFLRADASGTEASTSGANPTDVATLKAHRDCIKCDLRGITLDGVDLPGPADSCGVGPDCPRPPPTPPILKLDLSDFTGATITNVGFYGTELFGTIFDRVRFFNVLFWGSKLTGASFKNAQFLRDPDCSDKICSTAEVGSLPCCLTKTCFFIDGESQCNACDVDGPALPPGGAMNKVDFTGATFHDLCIIAPDLSETIFKGVTFNNITQIGSSNLAGADFSGTDFRGADLTRVDLSTALLSTETSFAGARLSDGIGQGVNLSCKHGEGGVDTGGCRFPPKTTQFKGADLSFVNLSGAGLAEADLGGATILDNANLIGTNLNLASLMGATLRGAMLGVEPGSGAETQLGGAYMVNVDLTDADLRGADLTEAHLYGETKLVRTKLDSADLTGAICAGAVFSGSLTDAVFNQAILAGATFNGAVLTGAKFDSAYLHGTDFSNASAVDGVTLRNAGISTMPGTWTFTEPDGTPYTYRFDATNLGPLATDPRVTCPDNVNGPCTPETLTPVANGPFPPIPECVPDLKYCYENCLNPANYDHVPPCRQGSN